MDPLGDAETVAQLRRSFSYGSRSNLDWKFVKDLADDEFGKMLEELFGAVSATIDDGAASRVIDVHYRWQLDAYAGHLGDPSEFRYRHDDVPLATLSKPLGESRVALLTSSGHFVDDDDPRPLGVENMTQEEAEARIGEFLREPPTLSAIPADTPNDRLRVRHGGYPVAAAAADPGVAFPLEHLRGLAVDGMIGEVAPHAYSFVGATSQGRLTRDHAPEWAERLRDEAVDAVLLVPV